MKRFIDIYSTALSALLVLAGCTAELRPDDDEAVKGPHVKLTVSLPGTTTKGDTIDGEDDWNENKVTSVYYFFYKDGSDTDAPKMSGHFAGLSLSGVGATKTWIIPTSADIIANQLFPSGLRECQTFVVANPPASLISELESKEKTITLKALRELSFSTTLTGKQDSFVMVWDGKSEVGSRTGTTAMDVDAKLRRVANKITVNVNVASEYYDKEGGWKRWVPEMSTLKVEFYNGMSKANLCGDFSKLTVSADTDYFTSNESSFGTAAGIDKYFYMEVSDAVAVAAAGTSGVTTKTEMPSPVSSTSPAAIKVGDKYYKLEQYQQASSAAPFYTYPMTWEFASATEPFLMFELAWTPHWVDAGGQNHQGTSQTCYYKLMLSQKSMTTNGWYDVTADLRVLGSFDKFAPTQQYLHEDYVVLEWENAFESDQNNVDAEIKDARYLAVPQTEYVLNNQTKLSVPFSSSHECDFEVIEVYKDRIKEGDKKYYTTEAASWFKINGSVLEFEHALHNALDADLDCTPYYIKVRLYHEGETPSTTAYQQTVTITQYPAVFIKSQNNPYSTSSTYCGYLFINGYGYGNSMSNSEPWGGVYYAQGTAANSSPDMVIISVSKFDTTEPYIIGDPRKDVVDNLSNWGTGTAKTAMKNYPALYGDAEHPKTSRTLNWYYPTYEDEAHKYYISPKFRIPSGAARVGSNLSMDDARHRCATYQEDGYPAGRWRLPTHAESEFMIFLSMNGFVKQLYDNSQVYWYAGGTANDAGPVWGGTGGQRTRCVYDEWYWEIVDGAVGKADTWRPVDYTKFYWGDQPR